MPGKSLPLKIIKVVIKVPKKSISVDSRGNKFQDLFSKLHKGKQRDQKFLLKMRDEQFTLEEKIETSMYYTKKNGDEWYEVF